jgi:asparagine synthase (glutamine-hydrolysing)
MCGIAGWSVPQEHAPQEGAMGAMLASLAHRGPDGEGVFATTTQEGRHVCLGHRRLAIIDPNGAAQPMRDEATGTVLVFNGEIYNFRELRDHLAAVGYRFHLDSDTEVLLRAWQHWGERLVHRLRGMFAFAVWDAARERLFLARDRYGEKPLFLCQRGNALYFASEIKALLRLPACRSEVDLGAVWDYLSWRYVPGPRTLLKGIRKLMPGTAAIWENGDLHEWRYWTPPDRLAAPPSSANGSTVDEFLERLEDAVQSQMVSDVPFGAFLSGGLDSSMIVGLMSRHCPQVNTFSVGFAEAGASELPFAALVAKQFGTVHREIVISHKDVIDNLPTLIAFRDAPVCEPSDVAIHLMAREASRSVKMVLTGEGSDEILGGYPKHVAELMVHRYQMLPQAVRDHLIAPLASSLPFGFRRVKTAIANLSIEDWRERYVRWFGALNRKERDGLSVLRLNGYPHPDAPPFDADTANSPLRRLLYFDQTSWLPDNLLERGDRMTMAASIESRVPFLDHRLAEFVSSLPDEYRVRGLATKWILRSAARRVLPEIILKRPKVGFRVPVNRWFQDGLRDYVLEHLRSGDSLTRRYYDAKALDRVLAEHMQGRHNHEKLIWSLLNLELWHRQYAHASVA